MFLIHRRYEIVQSGVTEMGAAPGFDILDDGRSCLLPFPEGDRSILATLICSYEFEDLSEIEPISRANQAAVFEMISCSKRSRRFSWSRRTNSSRSCVVNSSLGLPSSRSAWATQLGIASAVGSSSFITASGSPRARTNSTMRRRNSGGYGGYDFGIMCIKI
jgi:hypothetical protein